MNSSSSALPIGAPIYEADLRQLHAALRHGTITVQALAAACVERIEAYDRGPFGLASVIELNPDLFALAAQLDAEIAAGQIRGPLHGLPILLKDNLDSADQMATTAGSLALLGSRPSADAGVVAKLRAAGALIVGKTNLSEWANFRSTRSVSGWSSRGGQTRNPYDRQRNPCGSSSGSAVAVAASLCWAAIGTETDGSIVCPSSLNGVVGIKPTVGVTSRAGVVPISASQDTVGPHARSVTDAAWLLAAIAGPDARDPATQIAARFPSDPTVLFDVDGLRGRRIGVLRNPNLSSFSLHSSTIFAQALLVLQAAGAELVDPLELTSEATTLGGDELTVLLHEFKAGLNAYLATRVPDPAAERPAPTTLSELIAFNEAYPAETMPFFGQELLLQAEACGDLDDPIYLQALARSRDGSRSAIDALFAAHQLDAIVAPTAAPAWLIDHVNGDYYLGGSSGPAARAGYPLISLPAGFVQGLPIGLTFMGQAFSEPNLVTMAYAFEQMAGVRRPPLLDR